MSLVDFLGSNTAAGDALTVAEVEAAWRYWEGEDRHPEVAPRMFLSRREFRLAVDAGILHTLGPIVVHANDLPECERVLREARR